MLNRLSFVNVLRWDESQHPRDKEGQFADKKAPLEKKRRDFQALIKRADRDEGHLNRSRVELADAWTAWSNEIKNRKKPLKPDGAAAKKLDSYKRIKTLEASFHARYDEARHRKDKWEAQAKELLKVSPEVRSKVGFVENPNAPLHPGVVMNARRALQQFREFDGSGAFTPLTFPADKVDQFREAFGDKVELVQNADGTYSVPVTLKLSKAPSGRAHADFTGIHIAGGRDLERSVHHEVAHHIEMRNHAVLQAAIALREEWAYKPREVYKLNTVSPALDDTEVAVRGKFPDPYTAKLYPNDMATEMVSTGVESYLANPITFARDRPEHFNFIFDIMQGKYRSKV